jgi:hypothetical protein
MNVTDSYGVSKNDSLDCSIYVCTCDNYKDLWPGFFHCLEKHWPDNPFRVYLGANAQAYFGDLDVVSMRSDITLSWSGVLRYQLGQIHTKYVIVLLEDFFLRDDVSTEWIIDLLGFAKQRDAAMVRLIPRPAPKSGGLDYPYVAEMPHAFPYRICTQAAIWNRETLIALLAKSESIWEFEQSVEGRVGGVSGGFFATTRSALPYKGLVFHHVVEKGMWIPVEKLRCRFKGVPCISMRPVMPFGQFSLLLFAEVSNQMLARLAGSRRTDLRRWVEQVMPKCLIENYRRLRGARGQSPFK